MTCVVAVETEGAVHFGCDSYFGDKATYELVDGPKWFWRGELLIAHAGGFALPQVVRELPAWRPQGPRQGAEAWLRRVVAPAVRRARAGLPAGNRGDTDFLLGYRGRAYKLQDDDSVVRMHHGYAAIGAGEDVALGALAATEGKWSGADRVCAALVAAARHCTAVRAPFYAAVVPG